MRIVASLLLLVASLAAQERAAELVRKLGELPPVLPGVARSDGSVDPVEVRRKRVYADLRALGVAALPQLSEGLLDPNVRVRRGAALYLLVAGGTWGRLDGGPLDIRGALPALIQALGDGDARTRHSAVQAVGQIGPEAVDAVPALVRMLEMTDEGSRLNACATLGRIGTAARGALPILEQLRNDPAAGRAPMRSFRCG